jgi:hypothetical protein
VVLNEASVVECAEPELGTSPLGYAELSQRATAYVGYCGHQHRMDLDKRHSTVEGIEVGVSAAHRLSCR